MKGALASVRSVFKRKPKNLKMTKFVDEGSKDANKSMNQSVNVHGTKNATIFESY